MAKRDQAQKGPWPKGTMAKRDQAQKGTSVKRDQYPKGTMAKSSVNFVKLRNYVDTF